MDNLMRNRSVHNVAPTMPNLVPNKRRASFKKTHNEFIRHPQQFPLEFKRTRAWRWFTRDEETPEGDIGLSFFSRKYVPSGTEIELSIPLRGVTQKLRGTVVMVRETSQGYEIGLWLASADDASRARLVEQICHLECSLQRPIKRRPAKPRLTTDLLGSLRQPLAN